MIDAFLLLHADDVGPSAAKRFKSKLAAECYSLHEDIVLSSRRLCRPRYVCLAYNLVSIGVGDRGLMVEALVGPVPEKWPDGGWRELIEEKVAQKLPVETYVFERLMATMSSSWKTIIVEASDELACHISK